MLLRNVNLTRVDPSREGGDVVTRVGGLYESGEVAYGRTLLFLLLLLDSVT